MVICCAAPNCTNRQGKGKRGVVSFHRFPLKDPARLALWTAALQRSDWMPGPYSFLCSDHFSLDCFVLRMPDQSPLLKPNAVPSVFLSSRTSKKKVTSRPHVTGQVTKKEVAKCSLPPVQDKSSLVSPGDGVLSGSRCQTNIFASDDLKDPGCILVSGVSPNRSSACKFISSLHSYSRTSCPSIIQKAATNKNNVPNIEDFRETEHPCSQPLHPDIEVCGVFSSDVMDSVDLQCHIEVNNDKSSPVDSRLDIPLHLNVIQCENSGETISVSAEGPGPNAKQRDCFINPQDSDAINSLHSYCFPSNLLPGQIQLKKATWTDSEQDGNASNHTKQCQTPLNPALAPLAWMLGSWVSEPVGEGEFPTISPFRYKEELVISHVGQPMLNFTSCASDPDTGKAMHRECGFIRIKPGTSQVAFICAQNIGVVEIEEGEVQGEQLSLTSLSLNRISFAKEPYVQQISRNFRLNPEGKLEQTVSMATSTTLLAPHLHVTYRRVSS